MFGKKPENQQPDLCFFTIYDTKSGTYRNPVIAQDVNEVRRQLENNFLNPATQYDQYVTHSEDFQLFKLGTFDRKTGFITAHQPEHILNIHELRSAALQRRPSVPPTGLGIVPT